MEKYPLPVAWKSQHGRYANDFCIGMEVCCNFHPDLSNMLSKLLI